MILHGENLMISVDGSVLAASKSCNVDVDVDTIKVSSPTDGAWEHSIAGRKSWKVTTNHLLMTNQPIESMVEGVAVANPDTYSGYYYGNSYVKVGNSRTVDISQRGLTIVYPFLTRTPDNFDTYGDDETAAEQAMSNMVSTLDALATGTIMAIVSWDAYGMSATLKAKLESVFNMSLTNIVQVGRYRDALVIIGSKGVFGTAECKHAVNMVGQTVHAKQYFNSGNTLLGTPVKSMLTKVGQTVTMRMQVDGLANDHLIGTAICKSAKTTATKGNLLQGSFAWEGTGPLT